MCSRRSVYAQALACVLVTKLTVYAVTSAPPARAAGEPCVAGFETCAEDEQCIGFVCQDPDDPPDDPIDPPPPPTCDRASPCPVHATCIDGVCLDKPLPECGQLTKCPTGKKCMEGQCLRVEPECSPTRRCPDGDVCVAGLCEPGEPSGCRSDSECPPIGYICEDGRCVRRSYDPPGLTPIRLPEPPAERGPDDDPPVWSLPDGDDPFGHIPPHIPRACAQDELGEILCCSPVTGWSFEKDQVDEDGKPVFKWWKPIGEAFGRDPVYGNNVHIDRIMPPGYTNTADKGPAANVGGDYWAFSRDVNQQGKWWVGSSDLRADPRVLPGGRKPEAVTGKLLSPRFKVDSDYIRFFVGGGALPTQRAQLEVYEPDPAKRPALAALYDGIGVSEQQGAAAGLPIAPTEPDYVVVRASSPLQTNEYMQRRVAWDVRELRGRVARIVLVDAATWPGLSPLTDMRKTHLNADEFICTDTLDDDPIWHRDLAGQPGKVGTALTPIPLWGTSDTHTHPFVNLAFGGALVWGDPHDELADVYSCHGSLPEIASGGILLRPGVSQQAPQACSASALLVATVTALPCEAFYGIPIVGIPLAETCKEARWDVLDVLHNQSLIQAESLHGSSSPLSGGFTVTGAREVLQELTPFMNTFDTIMTEISIGDFADIADGMPDHVAGLVERLAWDTDNGRHSKHGVKGHQLYQKDMIRRAYQGGMRLIGLDVIDSRTITTTLHVGKRYDEWKIIRDTVLSTRHLVSCGNDPLFTSVGPLCDIAAIALSPADVRAIVGQNKLAIVLGTETDELGVERDAITMATFGHPPGTKDSIELQIADLHALGIRKVTAIHALNNPLGGAGIFNDTYLTGNNELSNQLDPDKVEMSSLTIPFFAAGNFTEDMFAIKRWETNPHDLFWDEWYQDHGGWVALDPIIGDDWIGGDVSFEYGFVSVATPLGFAPKVGQISDDSMLFKPIAFGSRGTWGGVGEVQFLKDVDQHLSGGPMCSLDGAGLPLSAKAQWLPQVVRDEHIAQYGIGHANAVGLRPMGRAAIEELVKRGMVIDLDHFSQEARVDTYEVLAELGKVVFEDGERLYPTFGVHTNSRAHERHGPFPDFHDLREERGFTAETDRMPIEFERSKQDGGTFSPGANAGYMTDSPEHEPQVRNDCDYSAKSFAHRYLWMMKAMDGRGLTPSTDMSPFFTAAAPRFGQHQCHLRTSYHDDMAHPIETAKEDDGTRLESPHWCAPWDTGLLPPNECKSHQFPHDWQPDPNVQGGAACKIWGKDLPFCPTYQNLQRQYAEGAGVEYEDYAGREWDTQPVQEPSIAPVKYVVARRAHEARDDASPRAKVDEIVAVGGGRQMWPMKKMKTDAGYKLNQAHNTGWDVNLDGMPHIGLFPDFLQDVRNVGVSWERMTPIFNAVEDYVRMWERQCELANRWAKKDSKVPGCSASAD